MTGKKVLLNSQLSEITEGYVDINEEIEHCSCVKDVIHLTKRLE